MARRGHSDGSTYRPKDGRWVATLELGGENGKQRGNSQRVITGQLLLTAPPWTPQRKDGDAS